MRRPTIVTSRVTLRFEHLESRVLLTFGPYISNIELLNPGPHSIEIAWQTSVPSTSQVDYGIENANALASPFYHSLITEHSMVIAGLSPDTSYNFQIISTDTDNNTATSAIMEFTTAPIPSPQESSFVTGGLTSYPVTMIGPNLLVNSSFEEINGFDPAYWVDNGFVADDTEAHTGSHSYRITDAHTIQYSQSARQYLELPAGSYQISGWIKLDELAATNGNGVRLGLDGNSTSIMNGTNDWQYIEAIRQVSSGGSNVAFRLETHGEPDGTAWFDDVELRRELPAAVEVFMQYPNYRGILFDDQSQVIKFDVNVNPPYGTNLADYDVEATITHEIDKTIIDQQTFSAEENRTVTFDGSGYLNGHTYLASFRLVRHADGISVYEYPAYRISKLPGVVRSTMATSFDEHNRFLVYGEPTFILGVYDSGLGYRTSETSWENYLTQQRRLFELPINYYLNYWYGNASASSMTSLMNVLQNHGIQYLQTGNAFAGSYNPDSFPIHSDDDYTATLASHPGFAGIYAVDEPIAALADAVFEDYQRIKAIDPDGISFGVSNQPRTLDYWRDVVDILATDPYPLYGAEPVGGYFLSNVADQTIATREAVQGSRPFVEVLQYFQFTSNSRWPIQDELRNMSYMAIAEGANGLFYWSLGAGALAYVESGWGLEKTELFNRLKAVMSELEDLEPALVGLDAPELLSSNDNSQDIRTRVKIDDNGVAYIIAYNYSDQPTSAIFHWSEDIPGERVGVHHESRSIVALDRSFTDTFEPYEAHVYVLGNRTPVAFDNFYEFDLGTRLNVPAPGLLGAAYDWDGDRMIAELVDGTEYGEVTLQSDGSFQYIPASGFFGDDFFTYRTWDGFIYSDTATVTIRVVSDNVAPISDSDSYGVRQGSLLVIPAPGVLENDIDPEDPLTAKLVDGTMHGSLVLNEDGSFQYTPEAGFTGPDIFTYQAFDGHFHSNPATVTILVHPEPGPTGLVINGQFESAEADGTPTHWLTSSSNQWQVVSTESHSGASSLRLQNADLATWTPTAHQNIYLEPGIYNLSGWIKGQDLEGGGVRFSLWLGSTQIASTQIIRGTTDWTLSSCDNIRITEAGTYTVRIDAYNKPSGTAWIDGVTLEMENHAPTAAFDTYNVLLDTTLITASPGVLENDIDPEDPLIAKLVDGTMHGSIVLNEDGSFQYIPEAGFTGTDSFTYQAFDGHFHSNPATVTILVHPEPGPTGLVTNGQFESAEADGTPTHWLAGSTNQWQVVSTESHSGASSLRVQNADLARWTPNAQQNIYLMPGIYNLSGWIKGQDLEGGGVRLSLWLGSTQIASTQIIRGTTDWTLSSRENILITEAGTYTVRIDAYNKPSGTAWIDGVTLEMDNRIPTAALDISSSIIDNW